METQFSVILLLQFLLIFHPSFCEVPVVLWHGMGDSCCSGRSMGLIKDVLEKQLPGVYVKSIKIGQSELEDIENSFFKDTNSQVEEVCQELSADPKLKSGFHAVGFSQGGQFLRALIQRCSQLTVFNFVSVAGQHQGVFGLPKCQPEVEHLCEYVRDMISKGAYNSVVQAQYWHDPLIEDVYKKKSAFLADINQERVMNITYKQNLLRLKNFVMVKSINDTVVIPRDSEWFGFYKPGQSKEVYALNESELYIEDKLGLKVLADSYRLQYLSYEGDHMHFSMNWFIEKIIHTFLL